MGRCALAFAILANLSLVPNETVAQLQEAFSEEAPVLQRTRSTAASEPASTNAIDTEQQVEIESEAAIKSQQQEKTARIWAHEPPLVRLARDKFGKEFTEVDAKFFAAVCKGEWADFRTSEDVRFDAEEPYSWAESPVLKADRIIWLCVDSAASKQITSRGIWLRGVRIEGSVNLYRGSLPYSLTMYDCLLGDGLNLTHAKVQELDLRNCCVNAISAQNLEVAENVYLSNTALYGGMNFINAQIGAGIDFTGGFAFHGRTAEDRNKSGVAIDLYNAKVGGDINFSAKFRSLGTVRLMSVTTGRGLYCNDASFNGAGEAAIDASRSHVAGNITMSTDFRAEGCVDLRRAHVVGDLDCTGGRFIAPVTAIHADRIQVGGQVLMCYGFHAEGEVRLINSVVEGSMDCDNGHFLNPSGDALSVDNSTLGGNLHLGSDTSKATKSESDLPAGFLARGTVRLWGTTIKQDINAAGARFETPQGIALLASNARIGSRVVLSNVQAQGSVYLNTADIEHELDLRGSHFDASQTYDRLAINAAGAQIRGYVHSDQVYVGDQLKSLRVDGLMSFHFANISMNWNLFTAELNNPGGYVLDASDCRVGGYVNLQKVTLDGHVSFSRAKIDGMWILDELASPEKTWLDMRFAHIWVIKDNRLEDWPPAGQLQLEGLVYDHFDDDSPLGVEDRLEWVRRQYATSSTAAHVRRGSPDPADADRRSPNATGETYGQNLVRGQETRAQQTVGKRAVDYSIAPAQLQEESSNAAPMMAPPELAHAPNAMPLPNDASAESQEHPPVGMAAPSGSETHDDQVAQEEAAESDSASDPAPPDPVGRRYITQPYTQLASVYRSIGQDEEANMVLVARAERMGELSPVLSAQGFWYRYLGRLIGYGYEPFRAIKIGFGIILLGTVVFAFGAHRNLIAETKLAESVISKEGESHLVSPAYPRFNPLVFSLDVFLPFVDLHQMCYWMPGERVATHRKIRNCLMHFGPYSLKWSAVLRGYLWFQTLAGWTLCTLLAAAVTGIVES